jgi:putative peptide zinc metalloprotease protein
VLGLTFVSFVFHEFGHAAACRYGGAKPGVIGVGIYLVWPALYTDVTDAYRLSRAGRLRTDLGGVYFNAVFVLGATGLWLLTGSDLLVVAVVLIHLEALQQLIPIVRLDGYYILSDLAGVPDLFSRMRPVLVDAFDGVRRGCARLVRRRRRPKRASRLARVVPADGAAAAGGPAPAQAVSASPPARDSRVVGLTRRARITISAWVAVVGPLLAANLVVLLAFTPSLVATAVRACVDAVRVAVDAFGAGDVVTGIAATVSVAVLALPAVGIPFLLVRLSLRAFSAARVACHGRPARTAGFVVVAAILAATLATCWVWRGI